MNDDAYTPNAEWYATLTAAWMPETTTALRDLLPSLSNGCAIDIASGIGSQIPTLRELGADHIYAVEPSAAMRVGLMTTIASDPDLRRRTTIVPLPFPAALPHLPDTWRAAIMLNAIGHLSDENRFALWHAAAARLEPGGRLIISVQPPEAVTTIDWTDFGTVKVGTHSLHTRGRADPLDHQHVEWTMEWTLLDAESEPLETRRAHHPWRVVTQAELTREAIAAGLQPVEHTSAPSFLAFERP